MIRLTSCSARFERPPAVRFVLALPFVGFCVDRCGAPAERCFLEPADDREPPDFLVRFEEALDAAMPFLLLPDAYQRAYLKRGDGDADGQPAAVSISSSAFCACRRF